ncbi:microtubule-associated protein 70-2 isoform X2 [Physcomitrium patens]
MTSSVPKKFVGKGMADSMSSSVDDDDNSLDGRNSSQGDRSRSIDTSQVHLFPTVPKTEEKPRRRSSRPTYVSGDSVNHFTGSDPVRLELARLENELKDKNRVLAEAQTEIKSLRQSDRQKQKAVDELSEELEKVEEKLKATVVVVEKKNLEVKRLNDERKAAVAAQSAAEATVRRVQASQKDNEVPSLEVILAPVEAEVKVARQEISKLQDTNRALERLTKSKEAALVEAERRIRSADAKAAMVEDLQNRNQELLKQIEICQEENKILDKMHRSKVNEVEKLSGTIRELEEAVLAGGAAVNAARDFQRQVQELMEVKRTLERELARAKISANRVASVVANDWKDENEKVMPVKQWLEERRFMQGEMQQVREKLACAERACKSEAQAKEKVQLRLKVLEEGVKGGSGAVRRGGGSGVEAKRSSSVTSNGSARKVGGSEVGAKGVANESRGGRSGVSQLRPMSGAVVKNGRLTSKSLDGGGGGSESGRGFGSGGEAVTLKAFTNGFEEVRAGVRMGGESCDGEAGPSGEGGSREGVEARAGGGGDGSEGAECGGVGEGGGARAQAEAGGEWVGGAKSGEDTVSGVLYDVLQKEVIGLRRASQEKDQSLKDKDNAIEMLSRKVDTLSKAMEVDAKKMRREVTVMEKEVAAMRVEKDPERRARRVSMAKEPVNSSQRLSVCGSQR